MKKKAPSHFSKKNFRKNPPKVELGSLIKMRYKNDRDDQAATYLVVDHINTCDDIPQIEIGSELGKAIRGKHADEDEAIYYEDKHRGIVGVYILNVVPLIGKSK
jgi:transcription elongation GreA/GreB family factor